MKRENFKAKVEVDNKYSNTFLYEVSVTTNGYQVITLPTLSVDDLRELNKVIRKFLKHENL